MINGWLMSRDTKLAEIRNGQLHVLRLELMPFYLSDGKHTLEQWLKTRSIDYGRANSRLLRRALKLSDAEETELVMSVNAVSVTDTYWIRERDSELTWDAVRFQANDFAGIALLGTFSDYGKPFSRTPEVTNTGSFEKCWKVEDGVWWLYKVGEPEHLYSEMAAYHIARYLGYDIAHYELVDSQAVQKDFIGKLKGRKGIIRTRDFTEGASVQFESAEGLGLKSSDMGYNYDRLLELSPKAAEQYLDLVTLDVLIYNLDRHIRNFGVLRNVDTGEIISLAPNYDNNLSLLAGIHGMGDRTLEKDALLREWRSLVQGRLLPIHIPPLPEPELLGILQGINCGVEPEDMELAFRFIRQGYELMLATAEQLQRFHQGRQPEPGIELV